MFSIGNALSPSLPLAGYTPPYTLTNGTGAGAAPTASDPLWLQILYGLQQANSILDPYILTEQEKTQMEIARLQAELERQRQQQQPTGISVTPAPGTPPPWLWAALAVVGVILIVLLLKK